MNTLFFTRFKPEYCTVNLRHTNYFLQTHAICNWIIPMPAHNRGTKKDVPHPNCLVPYSPFQPYSVPTPRRKSGQDPQLCTLSSTNLQSGHHKTTLLFGGPSTTPLQHTTYGNSIFPHHKRTQDHGPALLFSPVVYQNRASNKDIKDFPVPLRSGRQFDSLTPHTSWQNKEQ